MLTHDLLCYLWIDDGSENKLEIRPGGDFSYQLAKTKLVSISIQSKQSERSTTASLGPGSSNAPLLSAGMDESIQRDAQIQLSNLIDLQNVESVSDFSSFFDLPAFFSYINIQERALIHFDALHSRLDALVPSSASYLGTGSLNVQPEVAGRTCFFLLKLSQCKP